MRDLSYRHTCNIGILCLEDVHYSSKFPDVLDVAYWSLSCDSHDLLMRLHSVHSVNFFYFTVCQIISISLSVTVLVRLCSLCIVAILELIPFTLALIIIHQLFFEVMMAFV